MKYRDGCLVAGVPEADFWTMTIGEADRALTAYHEQRKDRAYFAFTEAMTTGLFVASMFGGSPPQIYDIYPELFSRDEEKEQEVQDSKSVANFINFANAFNKEFDNGDNRTTESENNG